MLREECISCRLGLKVETTSSSLLFKLQSSSVQSSSPPPQVFSFNLSSIFINSSSSFSNHIKFVHVYGKLVSILHGLFSVIVYIPLAMLSLK